MVQTLPGTGTGQDWHYALLSLDGCALLLPQNEIRILELVLDISTAEQPVNGVGWLSFEGGCWPVYCLDGGLNPLLMPPAAQRICALLSLEDSYFGLICADVTTVQGSEVRVRSLPMAMSRSDSPLCGLALHGDRVGLVSTAAALARLLGVCEAANLESGYNR